jgi:FixJ family two-component response regulator
MAKKKHRCFVAVVDDDDSVRAAIRDLLDAEGFTSLGFSSAEQFLRSRQAGKAGCLILDFRLPGMNGGELQQYLRARGSSVPVIYATAEGHHGNRRRQLLQAGALAVLSKPFDPEQLLELVRVALEGG